MITCTKRYDDFPFAHRQPKHDGHCSLIHGHNWGFEFTFEASTLDACGFVIDFGKLKWLKAWLKERFDHTLVLNADDPWLTHLHGVLTGVKPGGIHPAEDLAELIEVTDCSCEGLAMFVLHAVDVMIQKRTDGRVRLRSVTVFEDTTNKATCHRLEGDV